MKIVTKIPIEFLRKEFYQVEWSEPGLSLAWLKLRIHYNIENVLDEKMWNSLPKKDQIILFNFLKNENNIQY